MSPTGQEEGYYKHRHPLNFESHSKQFHQAQMDLCRGVEWPSLGKALTFPCTWRQKGLPQAGAMFPLFPLPTSANNSGPLMLWV